MNPANKTHIIEVKAASIKQNMFYIFNTSFLVIIAFIAGYNLKSRQIQDSIDKAIKSTEIYIQKTKENFAKSEQMLAELKNTKNTHFESEFTEFIEESKEEPYQNIKAKIIPPTKPRNQPIAIKAEIKKTGRSELPPKKSSGVKVYHTIKNGELLSMLVKKSDMGFFLKANPHITNPDLIYPGEKVVIKIPKQSILTGSYINNYFIHPITDQNGIKTYQLTKWIIVPESETLITYLIKKTKPSLEKSTLPYINLSDFTNRMKKELWGNKVKILNRQNKISRVTPSTTGIHFKTIKSHPVFNSNKYKGIKSVTDMDYKENINLIKIFLIKYLRSSQNEKSDNNFFNFMIFDKTIVQTDFLEASSFNNESEKSKILIGLIHITEKTNSALIDLERALSICKVSKGTMLELTRENLAKFH